MFSLLSYLQHALLLTGLTHSPTTRNCTNLYLPAPTGPYHVGHKAFRVNHTTHPDPFAPNNTGTSLLITIYYPTLTAPTLSLPYFGPATARLLHETYFPNTTCLPQDIHSWSTPNATLLPPPPNHQPLFNTLLLSPGGGAPSVFYTTYLSDLASHGFVVATTDHPYESLITEFPDGEVVFSPDVNNTISSFFTSSSPIRKPFYDFRLADTLFLLSSLQTPPNPLTAEIPFLVSHLNTTHVGMFGHSMGGAVTAGAMIASPDIISGINLDAPFWFGALTTDLARPFLMMAAENNTMANRSAFSEFQSGWTRSVNVTGTEHSDFSDIPVWLDLLGSNVTLGGIEGGRMVEIVRRYVGAFFGWTLWGGKEPRLLKGPTGEFPEVRFEV